MLIFFPSSEKESQNPDRKSPNSDKIMSEFTPFLNSEKKNSGEKK